MKKFLVNVSITLLLVSLASIAVAKGKAADSQDNNAAHPIFEVINNALIAEGQDNLQLATVEWITEGDEAGQTIFFNNRGNKQLSSHWVPDDPRNGNGTLMPWAIDAVDLTGDVAAASQWASITSAMQTWQDQNCSDIPLLDLGLVPFDYGYVQYLLGFGGSNGILPFLTHAGFLPGAFFDALAPGGSGSILGVTFTFNWTSPADLDNNGKADTAIREIYYNDAFTWGDGTGGTIDLESVVLHEAGHGLSQGHFGKAFRTGSNGRLHFAPHAVMNAGYTGQQRTLLGTDNGGHCSIWGSWPNN